MKSKIKYVTRSSKKTGMVDIIAISAKDKNFKNLKLQGQSIEKDGFYYTLMGDML